VQEEEAQALRGGRQEEVQEEEALVNRHLLTLVLTLAALSGLTATAHAASGAFDRAWGKDVITGGTTDFEICTVAINCKAGDDTTALGGELNTPWGAATDAVGNLYVADASNNRMQKFDSSGNFLRAWGRDVVLSGPDDTVGGGFEICVAANGDVCQAAADSTGLGGEMRTPEGPATDQAGNVYVADADRNRIQKFDSSGHFLRAWGEDVIDPASPGNTGTGFEICVAGVNVCKDGTSSGDAGAVDYPQAVATDAASNVYVASDGNQRIDKYSSTGTFQRAWGKDVTTTGSPDDTGTGFEICSPTDGDACQPGTYGGALAGEFATPRGLGADAAGNTYVADDDNHRIQKFDSSGTFLRTWGKDVVGNNTFTGFEICVPANGDTCKAGVDDVRGGEMDQPFSAATDPAGNVYVADRYNNRVQKFDTSGNFQRAWGEDVINGGGTGFEICVSGVDTCKAGTTTAPALGGQLDLPPALATDAAGAVYVTDASNNRLQKFADPAAPGGGGGPTATPPTTTPPAKAKCKKHNKNHAALAKKKCKKKKKR
jgi:tripartite motif-containing protein 71